MLYAASGRGLSAEGSWICGSWLNNTIFALDQDLQCDCRELQDVLRLQNNVTLDLNGNTMQCLQGTATSIAVEGNFNTIRNGSIRTSPDKSIQEHRSDRYDIEIFGSNNIVEFLRIERPRRCRDCHIFPSIRIHGNNNTVQHLHIEKPSTGVVLHGTDHILNDVTIEEAKENGIVAQTGSARLKVTNTNLVLLQGVGISLINCTESEVLNTTIVLSSGGVEIVGGLKNRVTRSYIDSRGNIPIVLDGNGTAHIISHNTLAGKAPNAVYAGPDVASCSFTENYATTLFHPSRSEAIFLEVQDSCPESSNVWVNNRGGATECLEVGEITPTGSESRFDATIFDFFSTPQYAVLSSILFLTTLLSVLGSSNVVYLILYRQWGDWTLLHRILLGLCCCDFISSFSGFLQPMLLPSDTMLPIAFGNMATCRIAGFGVYFFLGSTIYFCELSLYFYLTIRHAWTETKTVQFLEPWVHVIPWTIVLTHNILGIALNVFQPSSVIGLCLIGCELEFGTDRCVEGFNPTFAKFLQIPSSIVPAVCALLGVFWTVGVWKAVYSQEATMSRYAFENPSETHNGESNTVPLRHSGTTTGVRSRAFQQSVNLGAQHKKTEAVAQQAIRYCAAYLNSFIGGLIWTITRLIFELDRKRRLGVSSQSTGLYFSLLIVFLVHPLFGFLNWLTYVCPLVRKVRRANPRRSWVWSYNKILTKRNPRGQATGPVPRSTPNDTTRS